MAVDNAHRWDRGWLESTVEHIRHRADTTPTLTAVRYSGESATYAALADSFDDYEFVTRARGFGPGSVLIAGVLHCLPSVGERTDQESVVRAMSDIVAWLGRDVEDGGYGQLRAVG